METTSNVTSSACGKTMPINHTKQGKKKCRDGSHNERMHRRSLPINAQNMQKYVFMFSRRFFDLFGFFSFSFYFSPSTCVTSLFHTGETLKVGERKLAYERHKDCCNGCVFVFVISALFFRCCSLLLLVGNDDGVTWFVRIERAHLDKCFLLPIQIVSFHFSHDKSTAVNAVCSTLRTKNSRQKILSKYEFRCVDARKIKYMSQTEPLLLKVPTFTVSIYFTSTFFILIPHFFFSSALSSGIVFIICGAHHRDACL